jgi:hypothetical protein
MATSDPQAGLKFEKFPAIFPVTRQFERRPVRGRLRPQPMISTSYNITLGGFSALGITWVSRGERPDATYPVLRAQLF